jgi:TrmH family RNA methyltransferase
MPQPLPRTTRRITSRQNPIVSRYRDAARGRQGELMLLDGLHLVAEAVDAGIQLLDVAMTAEALHDAEVAKLLDALPEATPLFVVAPPVMDALSPVHSSSAIVATAARPKPATMGLYGREVPLVLIAVDVQDPGNLGAIVRVAEAGGASGVATTGTSADPFGWKALRGSMGSAFRLPVLASPDSSDAVDEARRHGCRVVATVARGGSSLYALSMREPLAILIGGEGRGLAPALIEQADERVTIPMQPPVESLNAAVAAALVVYEGHRQRQTRP